MTASFAPSETDDHPEVTEISALTEGLLPPGRAADVEAHLLACALCADVRSSLEEIRGALGTLPGPVRMPEDIAGRIDAALAAEALLGATKADGADDPTRSASPPEDEDVAVSRETAPPAPTAEPTPHVAASAGSSLPGNRGSSSARRPPGRPAGSSGPGRTDGRPPRRRRRILLVAAGACAALALGGVLVPVLMTNDSSQTADQGAEAQQPNDINAAQLEDRVQSLLAGVPSAEPKEDSSDSGQQDPGDQPSTREDQDGNSESSPTAPFGAESAVSVPTCIIEGIDRTEAPLAVSRQSYEGSDSFLVVLPRSGDANRVDAYVVDASCTSSGSDNPGRVIAQETVPRH